MGQKEQWIEEMRAGKTVGKGRGRENTVGRREGQEGHSRKGRGRKNTVGRREGVEQGEHSGQKGTDRGTQQDEQGEGQRDIEGRDDTAKGRGGAGEHTSRPSPGQGTSWAPRRYP